MSDTFDEFMEGAMGEFHESAIPSISVPYEAIDADQTLATVNANSKNLIEKMSEMYIGGDILEKYPFITSMLEVENVTLSLLASQLKFTKHLAEEQFKALNSIGTCSKNEIEKFFFIQEKALQLIIQFNGYVRGIPVYMKQLKQEMDIMSMGRGDIVVNGQTVQGGGTKQIGQGGEQDMTYKGTKGLIEDIESAMESAEKSRKKIGDVKVSNTKQKLSWRIEELKDDDLTDEEIKDQLNRDFEDGKVYEIDVQGWAP